MGFLPNLLDYFSTPKIKDTKLRVHMDDPLAVMKLSDYLAGCLAQNPKKEKPVLLCIGTDRSTGDSLGPLTGWRLTTLLQGAGINIYGTVDHPVHAQNLEDNLALIRTKSPLHPIIAIDACLGSPSNIGTILIEQEPLKPGAGVAKTLPPVGDLSISGIVNVGGFMELQVLQNTRLSLVLKMSHVIANSIFLAMQKINRQEKEEVSKPLQHGK